MNKCRWCRKRIWPFEFSLIDQKSNREDWYFHQVKYRTCYNKYLNMLMSFDINKMNEFFGDFGKHDIKDDNNEG